VRYTLPTIIRTQYFQPRDEDLPQGGFPHHLEYRFQPLATLDVQELTRVLHEDVLIYAATGSFTGGSAQTGVFTQIYHIHNGMQLPMFAKPEPLQVAFGSGQKPNPILPTYFVPAGDSLMMEVRSLDRTNPLNVETVLFATGIDRTNLTKYQKMVLDSKRRLLNAIDAPNKDVVGDEAPDAAAPLVLGPTLANYPAPGAAPVVIFSYQVPPGQRARIFEHALQHVGGNPPELSLSGATWSFKVNGAPLKGLGMQTAQIGAFATPDRVVIWLTENDLFTVDVSLPAGGNPQPGQTGYRINGWTAPLRAQGSQA
jgi:hypothetical protein